MKAWFSEERFWRQYMTMEPDGSIPRFPAGQLDLPVDGRWGLRLATQADLAGVTLSLLDDGRELTLGWDDQSHWHPHALRWSELQVLCRAVALRDSAYPHPGPALVLLHRFCPLVDSDLVDTALSEIRAAFVAIGFPALADAFAGASDFRGQRVRWEEHDDLTFVVQDESGDARQRPIYSLRTPSAFAQGGFPFRELAEAVASATVVARPQDDSGS